MVGAPLINPCACPIRRMKQQGNSSSRDFLTNHIGLALGSVPTVGGVGGQGDRCRLSLRGFQRLPVVARHLVSPRVPRRCLRRVIACRSPPPASRARCLHTSPAASRPRAARSACCLLAGRAPQVSFNILFKACRCASRSDVTNAIVGADIDSVGIVAGRRCASLRRPSAVPPRSPARVPCIPRTLHIPPLAGRVHATGLSGSGGGSANFAVCSSCARRRDRRCGQWAARAVGRGQGAAARRSRRVQKSGLAGVGARDGWAAWRELRATPASLAAVRLSVGGVPCGGTRAQHGMEVA